MVLKADLRETNRATAVGVAAALLSLAVSAGFIILRPDVTRGAAFLFADEAANLFVADAIHRGQSRHTEVAFPYGPVSIHLNAVIGGLFGNTPLTFLATMAVLSAISSGLVGWQIGRNADWPTAAALSCGRSRPRSRRARLVTSCGSMFLAVTRSMCRVTPQHACASSKRTEMQALFCSSPAVPAGSTPTAWTT